MDFGDVLRKTWNITWRNKGLWVLGILASCGRGGGSGGNGGNLNFRGSAGDFANAPDWLRQLGFRLQQFFESVPEGTIVAVVLALACLGLFLALLAAVLSTLGEGGLISGFHLADSGEPVTLSLAFRSGATFFWRLVGIQLLIIAVVVLLALVIGGFYLAVAALTLGIGLICLIPLICILIPVAIAASVYITLVKVALVVEDLGVFEAFSRTWQMIRKDPGPVIVMGLLLIVGGILVGIVLALPFILVAGPAIAGLLLGTDRSIFTGVSLAALCFAVYLPVLIVLQGIVATYVEGAWTLTYRRLTGQMGAPLRGPAAA